MAHLLATKSPLNGEVHYILGPVTYVTSEGQPLTEATEPLQLPFFV